MQHRYKANTGRDLTTLAEATDYLGATKQPILLTTIQVGVWFGEHFGSALSSYRHFSDLDGQQVCAEDAAQFAATVRERFAPLAERRNSTELDDVTSRRLAVQPTQGLAA